LARAHVKFKNELKQDSHDAQKGVSAVLNAILKPLWQIAENAGFDGNEVVNEQLISEDHIGFDAKLGEWKDLQEAGIVDPTKVTRNALLNAASIASLFLTTEAAVTMIKEDTPAPAMPEMY